MQKIVIDTNVIVSSIIQRGYPNFIIDKLFIEQKFQLCVSEELLAEYYEVLARPKFSKYSDFFIKAENVLAEIENRSLKFSPVIKLDFISDDDDNMILELAHDCTADFIITGNTRDFTFPTYNKTKIVTPKDYWENYKPY